MMMIISFTSQLRITVTLISIVKFLTQYLSLSCSNYVFFNKQPQPKVSTVSKESLSSQVSGGDRIIVGVYLSSHL